MPNPAQPEQNDTRERILAAAGHVFACKGFQAATLDEIAASAGMTKGAIYWHFRSKNDLFFALLDHKFSQQVAPLPEEVQQAIAQGDPQRAVTGILRAGFARMRADPDWPRLYLEFIGHTRDDSMREQLARFHRDGLALAATHLRTLQQAGLVPAALDTGTMAIFWSSLFDGLMLAWIINPQQIDHDALVERIVAMLWDGLAPDTGAVRAAVPGRKTSATRTTSVSKSKPSAKRKGRQHP